MANGILVLFVTLAFIAAVLILSALARLETRKRGSAKLAAALFYAFIAGMVFVFYLDDVMVSARSEETVRTLFHVPDDIEIVRVYGGDRTPVCYRRSVRHSASIQLTPDQFARYAALVEDRSVWQPVSPPHYSREKSRLQFSVDALTWHELPEPRWQGSQQLVWRIAGRDVRRGMAQCYTLDPVGQSALKEAGAAVSTFRVTPCNPRARVELPAGGGRVAASLDFDNQRLTVAINFDSKPDYCNNRVSNWLGAALGRDDK